MDLTMSHMTSIVTDRRLTPRLRMSFAAEVVLGATYALVSVQDLSETGCVVEIRSGDHDVLDKLGVGGILHFLASPLGSPGVMLAFVLRNVRSEGLIVTYGLEFRPLLPDQRRKLLAVMEAMAQEDAEGSP